MRIRLIAIPLVAALTAGLSACSGATSSSGLQLVTSFYPLQFITEQVAGDHAEVVNLTHPGQEPHDLELSPVQVGQVATADLVVYQSDLQASVAAAVDQAPDVPVVDAASVADLMTVGEEGHGAESGAEAESGHEEEHGDDHEHGDLDPHFWQDPIRLRTVADAVADALVEIDPANADDYRANAEDLGRELTRLDDEFQTGLADCDRTSVVVSHDAFGYLSKYGLQIHAIAGLSPDAEPTPADLAELSDLIRTEGITTVFSEPLVSADLSDTLASDTGLQTAILDPIEGLTDDTADQTYLTLMRANLAALQKANGCQ